MALSFKVCEFSIVWLFKIQGLIPYLGFSLQVSPAFNWSTSSSESISRVSESEAMIFMIINMGLNICLDIKSLKSGSDP